MGLPQAIHRCTPEEYLRLERDATEKHEFYRGEVFAMSGGTPRHSLVIANVISSLSSRLRGGPCQVYDSNLRIRIPRTTLFTYPDVSVACEELKMDALDRQQETVLNPTLIVEVLSPSTEAWDRGGKWGSYQQIDSLRQYVLVSTDAPLVETFLKQQDGSWRYTAADGMDARVVIQSLRIELPLSDVYHGVRFPPAAPPV